MGLAAALLGLMALDRAGWGWVLRVALTTALTLIFVLKVITAQDRPQLIRAPEHDEPNT